MASQNFKYGMIHSSELRPCRVTTTHKTPHGTEQRVREGLFHTWTNEQWTYSPVSKGQVGGQMAMLHGVVEFNDGKVGLFLPQEIQFLDGKVIEFYETHAVVKNVSEQESPQ